MHTPIYESSTQFLHWRHSPEHLASVRAALNATAVAAIRLTLEAEKVSGNEHLYHLAHHFPLSSQARRPSCLF